MGTFSTSTTTAYWTGSATITSNAIVTPANSVPAKPASTYFDWFRRTRKRYLLEIDKVYLISFAPEKIRLAKFIQSTPRGFNFVDIETERLLFKKHIYRCPYQEYDGYVTQTVKNDFYVWMLGHINVALPLEEQVVVMEE